MSDFIVLGLIPGTNTQLTFTLWLTLASTLFAYIVIRRARRSRSLRYSLLGLQLLVATRHLGV